MPSAVFSFVQKNENMAKRHRILIPSDFLTCSLVDVVKAIENNAAKELDIVLAFGKSSSTSITELLGITKDDSFDELQSESFIKSCQVILHHFSDKKLSIYTDFISSKNPNYIKNYMKGNKIDEIIIPEELIFVKRTTNHFDLTPILMKHQAFIVKRNIVSSCQDNISKRHSITDIFFKEQVYAKS